jgi:hypothetical protein
MLASAVESERRASPGTPQFSQLYAQFLKDHPSATDPAREIAFAAILEKEQNVDEAASLYQKIISQAEAPRPDRASATFALQRLQHQHGQLQASVQTGLALQHRFPKNLALRFESWRLLRVACRSNVLAVNLQHQCSAAGDTLLADLRSAAQANGDSASRRARSILLEFTKEEKQP